MRALVAAPGQAVSFLGQHLRPAPDSDPKHLARLIADLDDEHFAVREKAVRELEKLGPLARPALRLALTGQPSAEVRRRIESILEKARAAVIPPDVLRAVRAVEVLDRIGTKEARAILASLAQGAPNARLTREARTSLARIDRASQQRGK